MRTRHHAACAALALTLASCGSTAARVTLTTPGPPSAAVAPGAAAGGYHLLLRAQSGGVQLEQVASGTGAVQLHVPDGVVSPDHAVAYVVERSSGVSVVRAYDLRSGLVEAELRVPDGVDIARTGAARTPTGLSPDGSWLVLLGRSGDGSRARSHLVLLRTALDRVALDVTLPGDFSFDGVSDHGNNVFLLEGVVQADGSRGYHVRRLDVATRALDPQVVVAKNAPTEQMRGVDVSRTWSADGDMQYTAYAFGVSGPFVHALNLSGGWALCLDLPVGPSASSQDGLAWSLVRSRDGATVLAVNGATGAMARIDAANGQVLGTAQLPEPAVVPAGQGRLGLGAATVTAKRVLRSAAALSTDGRVVYVIGRTGVLGLDTGSLAEVARFNGTALPALSGVTVSPDGRWVYAVTEAVPRVVLQLDARTGAGVVTMPMAGDVHEVVSVAMG